MYNTDISKKQYGLIGSDNVGTVKQCVYIERNKVCTWGRHFDCPLVVDGSGWCWNCFCLLFPCYATRTQKGHSPRNAAGVAGCRTIPSIPWGSDAGLSTLANLFIWTEIKNLEQTVALADYLVWHLLSFLVLSTKTLTQTTHCGPTLTFLPILEPEY